jgi:hypothetical protein
MTISISTLGRQLAVGAALAFLGLDAGAQAAPSAPPPAAPLTAAQQRALLMDPTRPFWRSKAPDTVALDMETSRGTITIELIREWAPNGVDRFYNLARAGFFDDTRFYRVLPFYIAQFGQPASPAARSGAGASCAPTRCAPATCRER